MENNKIQRIKELVDILNVASDSYYQFDNPIMSDKKYDDLMDELENLEAETGVVMSNSPLHKVQGSVLPALTKVVHSRPMLSSNKTKDAEKIKEFIGDKDVMASYKLDGLTLVTRYWDGKLIQAITRGSGYEGEDVTEQAKMIANIPLEIPCKFALELRGECVISWENFNKINESLEEPYSHPRNLAAGSLRTLDTNITKERNLEYVVFEMISFDKDNTYRAFTNRTESLDYLDELGFTTVERVDCTADKVDEVISKMTAENCKFPVDGLIFNYQNLARSASLGATSHHPLDMIALKWFNETFETELLDIEWNTTRTGRINPTAIFVAVLIEGSAVARATVHNVSIMEELKLGKGDTITVYKSNQIIPAIDENLTMSGTFTPPAVCPCCGGETEIHNENGSKTLYCINPDCPAKLLSKLEHACSKNALNIDGMSEAILRFLYNKGWVKSIRDIYTNLSKREIYYEWINCSGFGKKSVDKLLSAIEKSRFTTLDRFLYAQSIPLIGRSASKDIANCCKGDIDTFCDMLPNGSCSKLLNINGFGDAMYKSLIDWYNKHWIEFLELKGEFNFESHKAKQSNIAENNQVDLSGKIYVITGSLNRFANREELSEKIISLGGKVSGSVSAKTTALINNDVDSNSSKNVKAKSLGISILSEEDFLRMIGEM